MTARNPSASQGFALYRLPHEDSLRAVSGSAIAISSFNEIGAVAGFVIAPFAIGEGTPLIIIEGESVEMEEVQLDEISEADNGAETSRAGYAADFRRFHSAILSRRFEKLVLARTLSVERRREPLAMFRDACRLYPQLFVALFSTPQSGTWLVATPELLLEGAAGRWHTMALAGTMKAGTHGEWSEKNRREQQLVAEFVSEKLGAFSSDICEEGPRTVCAGDVLHLRSDFSFSAPAALLGQMAAALHPTPAVAGLPRDAARDFILAEERCPRRYYSGFAGPVAPGRASLFVTLRCMELTRSRCLLHAGGGLLPESCEQAEWEETEAKLQTMRHLL